MTTFPVVNTMDAATFKETSEDPAITEAKMEGGYVVSRARFTRTPRRSFSFNFVDMHDSDKDTLQTFWETVQGSSDAFDWVHPATGVTWNVRFDSTTKMEIDREGYGPTNRWKSSTLTLQQI